jgi:ABC-type Na+ efflux pump permease subunit
MDPQNRSDILVGKLIIALGMLLIAGALWAIYGRYVIFSSWPTVDAQVTKSEISGPIRMQRGDRVYYTRIEFQFLADGKQFTASARDKSDNRSGAQMVANTYSPGTHHTIRYNPANPNDIRFDVVNMFETPVAVGIFGVAMLVIGLRWLSRCRRHQRVPV